MCDGVTQGRPGMELSLFSRDVIAMSAAVALTHDAFDAALYLGVCDKIVPGLLMAALTFGHLPAVFVPAGPMSSGLANKEKARIRREFAEGKVGRDALLDAEAQSYHGAGTCTFYGTANSNQMLMEVMGLHVAGAAFASPGTALRDALTAYGTERAATSTALGAQYNPVGRMIDERSVVNAIVALLATGGSTNHTIHLVAIAAAAGIDINWDDFDALSQVVPLIARVYPNGSADVNHFHAAGGCGFVIRTLLEAGFLHRDVNTVMGRGLDHYAREPFLNEGRLEWRDSPEHSLDTLVLRPATAPFEQEGGIRLLRGNLGRCVIKTSAMTRDDFVIEAPARVFDCQAGLVAAFNAGALEGDFVAVVRNQGPRANGMPELHQLTTVLGSLMNKGQKVALLTDGRMSGASGPVPAAIHLTPEAARGGPIGRILDGDVIRLDVEARTLNVLADLKDFESRHSVDSGLPPPPGYGLELFRTLRATIKSAEEGALSCL